MMMVMMILDGRVADGTGSDLLRRSRVQFEFRLA